MSNAITLSKHPEASYPTYRFEKWIQDTVAHYAFIQKGDTWYLRPLSRPAYSSTGAMNIIPDPIPRLIRTVVAQIEEEQLLTDWLEITADTFSFWDNEIDAVYDDL